LNSASIKFLLQDKLGIKVFSTPPYSSTSNGQIERVHSTLSEIMTCLRKDNSEMQFTDILFKAVQENNLSIHSVVGKKPRDIMFGTTIPNDPEKSEENRKKSSRKNFRKTKIDLDYHNKVRK